MLIVNELGCVIVILPFYIIYVERQTGTQLNRNGIFPFLCLLINKYLVLKVNIARVLYKINKNHDMRHVTKIFIAMKKYM